LTPSGIQWYNQLMTGAVGEATVTPIERRLVSAAVYERLLGDVLAGRLQPGDPLPSERALSEGFAVNRHAVREALKRLQQAGLVQIAQGGATRVCDWRNEAGLDVLTSLVGVAEGQARVDLLRDVLELRAVVGVDAARRCAERSTPTLTPVADGPFTGRAEDFVAFWAAIVAGAGNLATRLAFNTLVAAQRHGDLDPAIYASEIDDAPAQQRLADAIAAGDADAAAAHAHDLLDRTLEAVTA
jgi:GntR family transcriptional regulator, transcriptional repressor for pyruvate dehydrogenase complex